MELYEAMLYAAIYPKQVKYKNLIGKYMQHTIAETAIRRNETIRLHVLYLAHNERNEHLLGQQRPMRTLRLRCIGTQSIRRIIHGRNESVHTG